MAVVIAGRSHCLLCGRIIERSNDAIATPPFLRQSHRLARFSDAVFHRECFEQCSDSDEVQRLLARFQEVMKQAPPTLDAYEKWVEKAMEEFG